MVGKLVFEDPDLADTRMLRSMRAEGKFDAILFYCLLVHIVILTLLFTTTTTLHALRYNYCLAPLRRRTNFVRHEKQWMRRKRMKMERRYLRLQEGVEELKAYIKFKQDNKPGY